MNNNDTQIEKLIKKGVRIPNPFSVEISPDIDINRISGQGVTIYTGCKIIGKSTHISSGAQIGYEGPVTLENCWVGSEVQLKSGFFKEAVFLEGVSLGSGAHIREGTILEEHSSVAHTVGLKQTILFPFVTLGSLINFCDCLMAGGTDSKNHSEVGSSYIHFNYTPNQDKATPSLIGDVPGGVMLNQRPVFLGGQGGLVGPSRLAFGTIIAAGTIYRKDQLQQNRLVFEGMPKGGNIPYTFGLYRNIKRIVLNNIIYIANLFALRQWYYQVRYLFISPNFSEHLWQGLNQTLEKAIRERISRLIALSLKMEYSIELYNEMSGPKASKILLKQKQELFDNSKEIESLLKKGFQFCGDISLRDTFLKKMTKAIENIGMDYIQVMKNLKPAEKKYGELWLQNIIETLVKQTLNMIPSFGDTLRF